MLSEMSDMWRSKFAEQESWFKLENAKLVDQLQKMQERGGKSWNFCFIDLNLSPHYRGSTMA